jgi:hypothetical protein
MTAVVREIQISNTSGAVLTVAPANVGDDLAEVVVRRNFAAADIGTAAGQTRDASDPTVGCLCAQFYGPRILDVEISLPYRLLTATVTTFATPIIGVNAANTPKLGYNVIYNENLNLSNIYIFDGAAGNPGQLVNLDWIFLRVRLGNTANPNFLPLG